MKKQSMVDVREVSKCPKCGSTEFTYAGWRWRKGKHNIHYRRCKCGKLYGLEEDRENNGNERTERESRES